MHHPRSSEPVVRWRHAYGGAAAFSLVCALATALWGWSAFDEGPGPRWEAFKVLGIPLGIVSFIGACFAIHGVARGRAKKWILAPAIVGLSVSLIALLLTGAFLILLRFLEELPPT